jgi:hypothetical protein
MQDAEMRGARLEAPICDIAETERLQQLLEKYRRQMPPIKGCIHGGMVLEVRMNKVALF